MAGYKFSQCTQTKLDDLFGIRQTFQSLALNSWLETPLTISDNEKIVLSMIQEMLVLNRNAWNEQELSLHCIGPIFMLAQFTEPYRFNLFAERQIKAMVASVEGEVELSGEPDGLIATGYLEPKIPMFAFSEYKRGLDPDGDPLGQVLAAMLVGQTLNQQRHPLYGCYVIGHDWTFVILEGKHFMISRDFSAITEEIFDIFRILKALKGIIMELTV